MPNHTKAFKENLSIIIEELHLADLWGKASIIFTIHKDIFSQNKTKQALNKKLESLEYKFIEVEISKVQGNFMKYLLHFQNIKKTVFFISNIDWGGGEDNKDIYRILNLHRETFIEHKIKVIFLLNINEASKLPHYAPDFWAFRHLVLEFATSSPRNKRKPPVGIMQWQMERPISQNIDLESKISSLKNAIYEIPNQSEALTLHIEMQLELGHLFWQKGDLISAEKSLRKGLDLAEISQFSEARAKLINGLAIISYEKENYRKALKLLESVVNANSHDCVLLMNQAISMFALNQRYLAIKKGLKATAKCAQNSWVEYSLGFLYYFAGKTNAAITCFQKAVDISPNNVYFHEALAICYQTVGLPNKASAQLLQARKCSLERKLLHDVLKACIAEEREGALNLIQNAIRAGELSKNDFNRELILYTLFDPHTASEL